MEKERYFQHYANKKSARRSALGDKHKASADRRCILPSEAIDLDQRADAPGARHDNNRAVHP